jgi:Group II intron, maturase-specific domain
MPTVSDRASHLRGVSLTVPTVVYRLWQKYITSAASQDLQFAGRVCGSTLVQAQVSQRRASLDGQLVGLLFRQLSASQSSCLPVCVLTHVPDPVDTGFLAALAMLLGESVQGRETLRRLHIPRAYPRIRPGEQANHDGSLITQLNSIIRGWVAYHCHGVSKVTCTQPGHSDLQSFVARGHPKASVETWRDRYALILSPKR